MWLSLEAIKSCKQHLDDGIYNWRRDLVYYRQSMVDNTYFSIQDNHWEQGTGRKVEGREVEEETACGILNRFLEMGRAESERSL